MSSHCHRRVCSHMNTIFDLNYENWGLVRVCTMRDCFSFFFSLWLRNYLPWRVGVICITGEVCIHYRMRSNVSYSAVFYLICAHNLIQKVFTLSNRKFLENFDGEQSSVFFFVNRSNFHMWWRKFDVISKFHEPERRHHMADDVFSRPFPVRVDRWLRGFDKIYI